MPTFVDQRIHELLQVAGGVEPAVQSQENRRPSARQTRFHRLLTGLNTPPSVARIHFTLDALHQEQNMTENPEEQAYVDAIQGRILIGLYGNAMQTLLEEAIEADDAARWWWRVEKSRTNSAWFMVQSELRLSLVSAKLTHCVSLFSIPPESIHPYKYHTIHLTQPQHSHLSLFMLSILLPPNLPSLDASIGTHYLCISPPLQPVTCAREVPPGPHPRRMQGQTKAARTAEKRACGDSWPLRSR